MGVSNHGEKRIRERTGVNKKSVNRQYELAKTRGIKQNELKGNLKKWVISKVFASGYPHKCIIFNNNCFIIGENDTLITVIPVPSNLHKNVAHILKKRKKAV